jgi:hypothetical protein
MCTAYNFQYCCTGVHAEDKVGKSEIYPNSEVV